MRILALDIGGTAIKIGIVNEIGEILHIEERPTFALEGGKALIKRVLSIIGEFDNIDRVGISSAGQIDPVEGKVIFATDNIPGWTGIEIKKTIENTYNIPTEVDNDVNAAALGEAHYGAGKGEDSFLCITYGTGIGGAIIENGEVYRGSRGSAGEFGHIITHVDGRPCTCTGHGCYETYASTTALVKDYKSVFGDGDVNGRFIFELLKKEDENVKKIVNNWLKEVIIGLVSIIHVFNPSCIILGGGIMNQDYILEYIQKELPNNIMANYKNVKIKKAALGNNAGLLGATYISLKNRS